MKPGDVLHGIAFEHGLPLMFRSRHGAESHLSCLKPHQRERCSLVVLEVKSVEPCVSREEQDELPTLPDASVALGRMVGAERGNDDGGR